MPVIAIVVIAVVVVTIVAVVVTIVAVVVIAMIVITAVVITGLGRRLVIGGRRGGITPAPVSLIVPYPLVGTPGIRVLLLTRNATFSVVMPVPVIIWTLGTVGGRTMMRRASLRQANLFLRPTE